MPSQIAASPPATKMPMAASSEQVGADRLAVAHLEGVAVQVDVRLDQVDARVEGGPQVGHGVPGPVRHREQGSILHRGTV
jgi:hypothetical protein